jgi:hypothetical protein
MCARCIEIDDQTRRYRELSDYVRDHGAREAIARLTVNLKAEKLSLHPESSANNGSSVGPF